MLFTVSNAIPLKKDDTPQLKAEGEAFASAKLQEFQDAAKKEEDVTAFFKDLLEYVQKAQKNNGKLLRGIKIIVSQMKLITMLGINRISSLQLHALTAAIDGNRDNVSYYVLDYTVQWIERRLESTSGDLKSRMETIRDNLVTARDTLDANAQVFVKGVKDIKEWTHLGRGASHAQEIKDIIQKIDEGTQDDTLVTKTNIGVEQIKYLATYQL